MQTITIKVCVILAVLSCTSAVWQQGLTTPGLETTFMERCDEFHGTELARDRARVGRLYSRDAFDLKHCQKLWDAFAKAVSKEDPCSVNVDSYEEFLELSNNKLISKTYKDKLIFWSGDPSKVAADKLGSETTKYLAMKQFFMGFIFDAPLWWCGEKDKGFKYSTGPNDKEKCKSIKGAFCSPNEQFWEAGSKMLGEMSEGVAYVLFNAHDTRGPYRENSIFAKQELPALIARKKTTEVRVILYSENKRNPVSDCKHKSLLLLKNEVETMMRASHTKYTCQEDPSDFMKDICMTDENFFGDKSQCEKFL